jgi:hypothetical protein
LLDFLKELLHAHHYSAFRGRSPRGRDHPHWQSLHRIARKDDGILRPQAWLRLKGIRDIVSGLIVLTLMVTTNPRTVGIAFLVQSLTAFGDMSNVLGSGGSKQAAFSIHGATFTVMVVAGLFLINIF